MTSFFRREGTNSNLGPVKAAVKLLLTFVALLSSVHAAQVTLAWNDNSVDETSFQIERSDNATGPFALVATLGTNTTTYTDTSVAAGARYYFRVRAANAIGSSPYTPVVEAVAPSGTSPSTTTPPPTTTTPTTGTKTQTITFGTLSTRTYGNAPYRLDAVASSGLPVVYVSSNQNVAIVTGNVLTIVGAGTAYISATQPGDSTYAAATSVSRLLTVNKARLTVRANAHNREYGASNPVFGYTVSGYVNGETASTAAVTGSPSLKTNAGSTTSVGSYSIYAAIGSLASPNYTFILYGSTLTITKAPLTVTADNKSKAVNTSNPPLTATITGFRNGQTLATSGVFGSPALSTTATAKSAAGSYPISVSVGSLGATNYAFTKFVAGTLTVGSSAAAAAEVSSTTALSGVSARAFSGTGTSGLTLGFTVTGTSAANTLVRAVGPSLSGSTTQLSDPKLGLYSGQQLLASNDNWSLTTTLAQITLAVGATDLTLGSKDSAVVSSLGAGVYTAQLSSNIAESGDAALEMFDTNAEPRVTGATVSATVGTGSRLVRTSFTLAGSQSKAVVVRVLGPSLANLGVSGSLSDPKVSVYRDGTTSAVASNDNWGGKSELKYAFLAAGATALPDTSRDAALLTTLAPGNYTVVAESANGTAGAALVEIFVLP